MKDSMTCTRTRSTAPRAPVDLALVVTAHPPRLVSLRGRRTSIGRADTNDIVLSDRFVSSHHCQISEEGGLYHMRDLGSRNGTTVNGVALGEGMLWAGALLGVGGEQLLCIARPRGRAPSAPASDLVGSSRAMQALRAELACYAGRGAPVLLVGESGTGKELAARDLHLLSPRNRGPLIAVNCGALSETLALSELFGHERGAFTGAVSQRRGAFEQASSGTLFLDEIGELPPRLQATLLRTLETGTIRRVGSERELPVDVRVVAATNRDLRAETEAGRFRADLYHRLAVLRVDLPPLRHRLEDLAELAQALLARAGASQRLGAEALSRLAAHRWPGNVRELRNVLERACALSRAPLITPELIRFDQLEPRVELTSEQQLLHLVEEHDGNVTAAAEAAGVKRTTFRDRYRRALRRQRRVDSR